MVSTEPSAETQIESFSCPSCGAESKRTPRRCFSCGWENRVQPKEELRRFNLVLAVALAAFVSAFGLQWSSAHDGLAEMRVAWAGNSQAYDLARREGITYELARELPRALDGHYVLWDITPAGDGKAFHRGSEHEPIRVLNTYDRPWNSGKAVGSMTVLGRIQSEDRSDVGIRILQVL